MITSIWRGVAFVAGTSAIYVANQDGTGGMLSVTDGTEGAQTVHIALLGQYSAELYNHGRR